MSVKNKIKIAMGTGGLTVSSIVSWFLLRGENSSPEERKEKHYQTKISRFREIANRINLALSEKELSLRDPEDMGYWNQRFSFYSSRNWNQDGLNLVPQEARNRSEDMRDWCYETIEKNESDVKVGGEVLNEIDGEISDESKKFWDHCTDRQTVKNHRK